MDGVKVLHKRSVPGGDTNRPVSVQVERRTISGTDGDKTYVNLVICVGNTRVIIPRRAAQQTAEALGELQELARREYLALLEEQNG